mmetsp:Transcript_30115/g.36798  ORF Transcript_30115/g.36798 Transcript_30115/m.36798 type:complete len:893 (+) Transcript_30115:96-2774(+)
MSTRGTKRNERKSLHQHHHHHHHHSCNMTLILACRSLTILAVVLTSSTSRHPGIIFTAAAFATSGDRARGDEIGENTSSLSSPSTLLSESSVVLPLPLRDDGIRKREGTSGSSGHDRRLKKGHYIKNKIDENGDGNSNANSKENNNDATTTIATSRLESNRIRDEVLKSAASAALFEGSVDDPVSRKNKEAWAKIESGDILDYSTPISYDDHPYYTIPHTLPLLHNKLTTENSFANNSFISNSNNPPSSRQEPLLTPQNTLPLRIHFETSSLFSILSPPVETLLTEILPRVATLWGRALRVVPVRKLKVTPETCYGYTPIPERYITTGITNADLVVFVIIEECGAKSGSLAYAFPCSLDDTFDRPIAGLVSFCRESLDTVLGDGDGEDGRTAVERSRAIDSYVEVAVHELGHVLGFSATLLPYFRNMYTGEALTARPLLAESVECVDGKTRMVVKPSSLVLQKSIYERGDDDKEKEEGRRSVTNFEIVTPTVQRVVRNQFNCERLEGARLENQPTNALSCFGSHWDERLFFTEMMGPIYSLSRNVLSALSLALLQDSGWYVANFTDALVSPWGYGAGCEFVENDCIVNGGTVPSYGAGFFCNRITKVTKDRSKDKNGEIVIKGDYTCSPGHTHKALCDLFYDQFTPPPDKFQYFSTSRLTPAMDQADFCPVPRLKEIDCSDPDAAGKLKKDDMTSEDEVFGESSRCFDVRGNALGSICLPSFCNPETKKLEVTVRGGVVTCDYDGQVHRLSSDRTYFYCPKIFTICPDLFCPSNCSGAGKCDWSAKPHPQCLCFDPFDTTPGCYGADPTNAPSLTPSASPSVDPTSWFPSVTPTDYDDVELEISPRSDLNDENDDFVPKAVQAASLSYDKKACDRFWGGMVTMMTVLVYLGF